MSKATIKLTTAFADETTRDLEIGPLAVSAAGASTIKARVKAFNPADVAGLYVSDGGATCTAITAASIIITNEREINLN